MFYGPTPVDEALRWIRGAASPAPGLPHAARDTRGDAREFRPGAHARRLGGCEPQQSSGRSSGSRRRQPLWEIEMLAGDLAAAERAVRRSCELLEELGGGRASLAGRRSAGGVALRPRGSTRRMSGRKPPRGSRRRATSCPRCCGDRSGSHPRSAWPPRGGRGVRPRGGGARGRNGHAQLPRERPCRPGGDLWLPGVPRTPARTSSRRSACTSKRAISWRSGEPAGDSRSSKTYDASPEATTGTVRIARPGP